MPPSLSNRVMKLFKILSVESLESLAIHLRKEEQWNRSKAVNPTNPRNDFSEHILLYCTLDEIREALFSLNLLEAHSYLCEPQEMAIVRQPYVTPSISCHENNGRVYVQHGSQLELRIGVTGSPQPTFEWFHHNMCVGTSSVHSITSFSPSHAGTYFCKLQQFEANYCYKTLLSRDIYIDMESEAPKVLSRIPADQNQIILDDGETLILTVNVSGYPPPNFKWWKHNEFLPDQTENTLHIRNVNAKTSGTFECFIQNEVGEDRCLFHVKVREPRPTATQKKAFVIGNEKYVKHKQLFTAVDDAETLKKCLVKKGFDCDVVYRDLTGRDMRNKLQEFCESLQEGAYVVFYFAGHGFTQHGELCMMGVDAPCAECDETFFLREHNMLSSILEKKVALLVSVLDSCQKEFPLREQPPRSNFQMTTEVIRSYATSINREAYEKQGTNSFFMSALQSELNDVQNENETINNILLEVNAKVCKMTAERELPDRVKQVPELRSTSTRPFCFSDKIMPLHVPKL